MKLTKTIALEKSEQKVVANKASKLRKKVANSRTKKVKKTKRKQPRGLIFIGHLPHGFYEAEIRKYFRQFGVVTNVKVCRSQNTGRSKGYGYVEFAHSEVAKIAAETMNNYIMFKKRLVAEFVPSEKRPNKIFRCKQSMPHSFSKQRRREQNCLTKNKEEDEESHKKDSTARLTRLQKRLEKIKSYGIQYDVKPVDVPLEIN